MIKILISLGAVLAQSLLLFSTARAVPSNLEHQGRVIGGTNARPDEYPFAVFLMIDDGKGGTSFCGGSIISKKWILTAAHCVVDVDDGGHKYTTNSVNASLPISGKFDHASERSLARKDTKYPVVKAERIIVGVGSTETASAATYKVKKVRVHPDLNLDYFDNDIAVLKLHDKLDYSSQVQPIKLNTGNIPDGLTVTGIGWGLTSLDTQRTAETLQQVDMKTGNENICKQVRPEFDSNSGDYICVTTPDGKDTCSGDSGGPLLRRCNSDPDQTGSSGSGPWIQLGLTSYGDNIQHSDTTVCADSNGAGFYTDVSRYMDFITKSTGLKRKDIAGDCTGGTIKYAGHINSGFSQKSLGSVSAAGLVTTLTALIATTAAIYHH